MENDFADCQARELERLKAVVRRMHEADDRAGCGFYNDPKWLEKYRESRLLVGLKQDW